MSVDVVKLPRSLLRRLREEARREGITLEELILDRLTSPMDPPERAQEYAEASVALLEQARVELAKGDARQAAEKVWGAAALAVKAYALRFHGKRLASHWDLWEYKKVLAERLGSWVHDAWAHASSMHTCFYEGWCSGTDVAVALSAVERLVREVVARVSRGS